MDYTEENTALVHDFLVVRGGAENVASDIFKAFPTRTLYSGYSISAGKAESDIIYRGIDKKLIVPSWLDRMPLLRKLSPIYNFFLHLVFERIQFSPKTKLVVSDAHSFSKFIIPPPEAIHLCYVHTPPRFLWNQPVSKKVRDNLFLRFWWNVVIGTYFRISDYFYGRRINIVISNSEETALRVKKAYRRDSKVLRPPIDVKFLYSVTEKYKDEKRDGVLFLNRLEKYKDIDQVIKIWPDNIKLTVAGKGSQEQELRELAKDKPNITFKIFPSEEEKYKMFATHKALIYPNKEDFGIVMVEAIACGTPTIALNLGGALDIIKHKENGFLINAITSEELEKALTWLNTFEHSPDSKLQLRDSVVKFDSESFINKLHEIINEYSQLNK